MTLRIWQAVPAPEYGCCDGCERYNDHDLGCMEIASATDWTCDREINGETAILKEIKR